MYSRTLKSLLNVAAKLRSDMGIKSAGPLILSPSLLADKPMPCTTFYCCRQNHTGDLELYAGFAELSSNEKKHRIDEIAQQKIEERMAEDPSLVNFKKILDLEIDVWRQEGNLVPQTIRPRDWLPLLNMKSQSARRRYLVFLFKNEIKRCNDLEDKKARQANLEAVRAEREKLETDKSIMKYGFGANFIIRRVNEGSINFMYNWNSVQAQMFGNQIVFDCSYEKYMSDQELRSCARQLMQCHCINRTHDRPMDVILSNLNPTGPLAQKLIHFAPNLYTNDFPWTVTKESYLDIFDRSKLYYLSPNASHTMEKFDPDTVYIIGAYVDKGNNSPISMSIAKEHNLRMGRLPLDKYLRFGGGSQKNLTLNQVLGIMLYSQTDEWEVGMDIYVPKRKLLENRMKQLEAKVMRNRLRRQNTTEEETEEQLSEDGPDQQLEEKYGIAADLKSKLRRRKKILRTCIDDYNRDSSPSKQSIFAHGSQAPSEHDFSNAARLKLRQQWNK